MNPNITPLITDCAGDCFGSCCTAIPVVPPVAHKLDIVTVSIDKDDGWRGVNMDNPARSLLDGNKGQVGWGNLDAVFPPNSVEDPSDVENLQMRHVILDLGEVKYVE